MKSQEVFACTGCDALRLCINGRYCMKMKAYVEWYKGFSRPCEQTKTPVDS